MKKLIVSLSPFAALLISACTSNVDGGAGGGPEASQSVAAVGSGSSAVSSSAGLAESSASGVSTGSCTGPSCPCGGSEVQCPKGCVDLENDLSNCGSCGYSCPPLAGGHPTCNAGQCGIACDGGKTLCDLKGDEQLRRHLERQGQLRRLLSVLPRPVRGRLRVREGQVRRPVPCRPRPLRAAIRARTSRRTKDNCGGCGSSCGFWQCQGGACVCPAGDTFCNGSCVDEQKDATNCGACGNTCAAGKVCAFGTCFG